MMRISRREFVGGFAGASIASMASSNRAIAQNSGPIRIDLLAAELDCPQHAAMPLFELERACEPKT